MKPAAILLLISVCVACTDFPDPENTLLDNYSFFNNGLERVGFANEYISDSLLITMRDNNTGSYLQGMRVDFEITKGNGELDETEVFTDNLGNAFTRWKLGNTGAEQIVEANLFDAAGKHLTTVPFRAYAFVPGVWNSLNRQPDINISDLAGDSINGLTYAIANSTLFRQGERYFDWQYTQNTNNFFPRRIILGRDQTIYIGTWYGQVFKSSDHGYTWNECTKPWQDHSNYFYMNVTSDNYIWVTAWGKPLRCSRDGGQTWTTDSTGLQAGEMLGDMYRLTDGSLFFLSLNRHLSKSTDDGHTWTPVEAPEYTDKLYVTDKDELILFTMYGAMSIYKSSDQGETYVKKYLVGPSFSTLMDHTVHKYGKNYYVLIPGFGILQTPDFEKFEVYWHNENLNDMLMDDEGVIIAKELNGQLVHYRNTRD